MSNDKPQALGGPDSEEQYIKGLLDSRPKPAPIPPPTIGIDQATAGADAVAVMFQTINEFQRMAAEATGIPRPDSRPPNIKPNYETMQRWAEAERMHREAERQHRLNSVNMVVMDCEMEPMGLIEISHDVLRRLQLFDHFAIPLQVEPWKMYNTFPDPSVEVKVSRIVVEVIHVGKGSSNARATILAVEGRHSMQLLRKAAQSERHALEIIQSFLMRGGW